MEFAELIGGLIAIGSAGLTTVGFEFLQKGVKWVDGLSARTKQAIVLVAAFAVVKVNAMLGLAMPVDVLGWEADSVNALITAGLSLGVHSVLKTKKS